MLSRSINIILLILAPCAVFAWGYGDVVFNELMWMGTALSPYDEFLELRNMTSTAIDFSSTPWAIYRQEDLMLIIDDGVLPANGLFLICRRNAAESYISAPRDLVSNALVLTNSNTHYSLYAGPGNLFPLIDLADDGIGPPMSGRFLLGENIRWSMERNTEPGHGNDASNWHPACLSTGFVAGARERGTPGAPNYKNVPPTAPTVSVSPDFVADDSTVFAVADGVFDPDSIPDRLVLIFDWFESGAPLFTEIDSTPPFESSISSALSEPGRVYSLEVFAFDGTDSTGPIRVENIRVHFEKGELIINELAWGGSLLSDGDEWLEILNNSGKPIDFARSPVGILRGQPGAPAPMFTLSSGIVPPNEFFLAAKNSGSATALQVSPDRISPELSLRDDSLWIALTDFPGDPNHIIDEAGDGGPPLLGLYSPSDSTAYAMARNVTPGDGRLPASWHSAEVTTGFKPMRLERGSPRSHNLRNSPPRLEWAGVSGFETCGLAPNSGTMDTLFVWKVKYIDLDGNAPEFVRLLIDIDCDGAFDSPGEVFAMYRASLTDTSFSSGVIYKGWKTGLPPAPSCCGWSFRASDGLTMAAFPVPSVPGPSVAPTMRASVFIPIWRPEPAHAGETVITNLGQMPFLFNTGDVAFEAGLVISQADIYAHSSDTSSFSSGGWSFSDRADSAGINQYRLSALFTYPPVAPEPLDFNDYSEDLLNGEIKWFDGDTLGHALGGLDRTFLPGARWRLALRLDLPPEAHGFYRDWEHRISVRIILREPLP